MTSTAVYDAATDLLELCRVALDTLPTDDVTLDGAPDRRYVADGLPAFDCPDQLTVHAQAFNEEPTIPAAPGPLATLHRNHGRVVTVAYVVTITRCRPAGTLTAGPTVTEMNQAGKQHTADGWVLWNAIWRGWKDGLIFDTCDGMRVRQAQPLIPSGAASGWVLVVEPVTNGYGPDLSAYGA